MRADGGRPRPVISTPLKPPPPYCKERPFHSVGRFTSKRIAGAVGSTATMRPRTLQYCGMAGVMTASGGGGKNGSGFVGASALASTSSAESTIAPREGKPIDAASTGPASAAQAALESAAIGAPGMPAQAASNAGCDESRRRAQGDSSVK